MVQTEQERMEMGWAMSHVIIESGVAPGVDYPCRCDECKLVAQKMDEVGYLDHVKDKWWLSIESS